MIDPEQFRDEVEAKAKGYWARAVSFLQENFWAALGVAFLLGVVAGAVGG